MANTSLTTNWDMNNRHVQSSISENGVAVQASSVLVGFGPPRLKNSKSTTIGSVLPVKKDFAFAAGLIENVNISQNKQLNELFELGSKLRYIVPGRTSNGLSIVRLYLNGPSLLKVLYAFYKDPESLNNDITIPKELSGTKSDLNIDRRDKPGYNSLWLNLASQLFDFPIGMLLYFKDNRKRNVGAIYLENCYVGGHSFTLSASSTLFTESVQLRFDRIRPIELKEDSDLRLTLSDTF